jgi:hypothetical protein
MTKLISIFIVLVILFVGWHFFQYWEKVKAEQDTQVKKAEAAQVVPQQLRGMPSQLETSLQAAANQGLPGMRNWLKAYGQSIQDPRKAWIQLDYCVLLSHESPAEARRLFEEVKKRTPETSPVWPRIKDLEKTYE